MINKRKSLVLRRSDKRGRKKNFLPLFVSVSRMERNTKVRGLRKENKGRKK